MIQCHGLNAGRIRSRSQADVILFAEGIWLSHSTKTFFGNTVHTPLSPLRLGFWRNGPGRWNLFRTECFAMFNPWPTGLGAENTWPVGHGLNEGIWETPHQTQNLSELIDQKTNPIDCP